MREKATFTKPEIEKIKLNKVPSAIEGIRASIQKPEFDKPQFDKPGYEDNCKPQKEQFSNDIQRIIDQQNVSPSIARMIKDALKGKNVQKQKPGECPCTATTVQPRR